MALEQYRPSRFNLMPPITRNIIIINVIMFLLTQFFWQYRQANIIETFGLFYYESDYFNVWQFITYMFMHGSWTHILFNMFAVWMFGTAIENMWGPKRYLNYYILTGLGAALAHYAVIYFELKSVSTDVEWYTLVNTPVVGASGAVFGILIAFGMYFPNTLLFIIPIPFPVKAKYAVIMYGLVELFLGVANRSGDNVAHFAHLGGLICGFILIQIWKQNDSRYY